MGSPDVEAALRIPSDQEPSDAWFRDDMIAILNCYM